MPQRLTFSRWREPTLLHLLLLLLVLLLFMLRWPGSAIIAFRRGFKLASNSLVTSRTSEIRALKMNISWKRERRGWGIKSATGFSAAFSVLDNGRKSLLSLTNDFVPFKS